MVERGQTIRAVVRTITCSEPGRESAVTPLVELDRDTPCLAGVVGGGTTLHPAPAILTSALISIVILAFS